MALCGVFDTPFDGKYKYSMEPAKILTERMLKRGILEYLPCKYIHTAKGGARYDFMPVINSENKNSPRFLPLSSKSNKKGQKVAPHSIGQAQPREFCNRIGIKYIDIPTLKSQIQDPEFSTKILLPKLEKNTFDAYVVYYSKTDEDISLIQQISPIKWGGLTYSWTRDVENWKNSSTMKVDNISILEVQFHEKSRTNMAVRWNFKNLLKKFSNCFKIIKL